MLASARCTRLVAVSALLHGSLSFGSYLLKIRSGPKISGQVTAIDAFYFNNINNILQAQAMWQQIDTTLTDCPALKTVGRT